MTSDPFELPQYPQGCKQDHQKTLKMQCRVLLYEEHIQRLLFGAKSSQSQPDGAAGLVASFCESLNESYSCRAAPGMC